MSPPIRTLVSHTIVFLFLLTFLWSGFSETMQSSVRETFSRLSSDGSDFKGYPEFGQYVLRGTISEKELDLEHRRLIIVGDIHGMESSLDKLQKALSYSPSDLFVHLGDIIAKGPDSLSILQRFTEANVTGVRGNHEQKVIEWRGWIEWVESHKGGKQWLLEKERLASKDVDALKQENGHNDWTWPIPEDWKFMDDHYEIARSMTASHYSYLKSLPLVIHIPSLHTHLVHAGILPFDPNFSPTSSEQPLAHMPEAPTPPPTMEMRTAQETAVLTEIEQNTDPWVLLNMRSVLDNNQVSRKGKEGTPWSDLWDITMKRCKGYNEDGKTHESMDTTAAFRLPCLPINVIYGHAASRGLDVKRWSFGLDTGCVYGRRLTAMVITNGDMPSIDATDGAQAHEVLFGEHGSAQLVSISCS